MPVLSKRLVSPAVEWPFRPNGLLNKFTTPSMLQELSWLEAPPRDPSLLFAPESGGVVDLQLAPSSKPVTPERALERRRYLTGDYFARVSQASVVVLTLGLNEVWRDEANDAWLNTSPPLPVARAEPDRFTLTVTGVAENVAALEGVRARLKAANPDLRLVVTVSPVPMNTTFSGADVLMANTLSKSVLRAAAQTFADAHADVDYFPSYEMVMLGAPRKTFLADRQHVADRVVARVIEAFLGAYYEEPLPAAEPGFYEMAYLIANPDVEERVRTGELESGFAHWIESGRAQGRPMRPDGDNERLAIFG